SLRVSATLPASDRGICLSRPPGSSFSRDSAGVSVAALATYRSQIGRVDPSVNAQWQPARRLWLDLFAGRDTRSNEAWITSDLSNSINALFIGRDTRNWYRADVAELTANRKFETPEVISTHAL